MRVIPGDRDSKAIVEMSMKADMALMLSEFYKLRGLCEDGRPGREILKANQLHQLAELRYQ